jgi:enolase
MTKINKIKGRQVFDSRGNPTVEAEVFLKDGHFASAIVPSGASTGTYEAFELRDKNNKNYLGKSVLKAVENINGPIKKALNNIDINDQKKIDKTLLDLDGTEQKKKLGANAILAVSIASCKLAAIENNSPLYKYLGNSKSYQLPIPLLNIINGGVHAKNNLDIQEFMIRPEKVKSFSEAIRRSFLVIQNLKGMVNNTNVGDEGGFAPNLANNEEAIELIIKAIEKSGFKPGEEVSICLDVAANELIEKKNNRLLL